ncbi:MULTISPECIES: phosphoribosylaminoimidazolesuccinocarboxamide synthase [Thiorhodovibrio]|uniref:phosphoribosylaminoimidazolesuccinocarboxamide synthase n=1 Tax=Thiorhodovibrio TaxID=61593 RepID=UPI001913DE49|nr:MULTISPECIES: phosphoribosylaminoimidazolesuccinocarboxamide synthase [Thiorhodovibrio]MBK5968558.1 phosphoribosylaminoimidazolesuccinocarboxamide synthase [Thiorhodovibrio winogradskyi]WPL11345.1 Phosphoribosylaminoimidazole-succinocarboxamide synthase [Thiorhodovibrio litoralis]
MTALYASKIDHLPLIGQGKVRDIHAVDDDWLLIITSDRLSAFDVVLPQPIPGKGEVLTRVTRFWLARTAHLIPNQLPAPEDNAPTLEALIPDPEQRAQIGARAMLVRRLRPLPVEAVVRGYLIGSGWKDYQREGTVCGITLPPGLVQAAQLPEPIYTPATKAEVGAHDENIAFAQTESLLGPDLAAKVRDISLRLYREAAAHAAARGIIIADTKFEFGLDSQDRLHLIDEVLTPDSSRFWPADAYRPGISPPSFDKQYVRDYLEFIGWDKRPPGPELPAEVIAQTASKYAQAERQITS